MLTTIDIDKDSNTDILLVGAPMFMGSEKEEQGKVYVYALNQVTVTLVEIQEDLFLCFLKFQLIVVSFFTHSGKRNKEAFGANLPN